MKFNITSRKIILIGICIIIVGALFIGFNQFLNNPKNSLKIISMDLIHSDEDSNFTLIVQIKNYGSKDIYNAELNLIFIKDNNIFDSEMQSINLETKKEETYSTHYDNVLFEAKSSYKAIATIYLENTLLDTKTITRQF